MGLRVAVDDFGTGFSSPQYLQRLPIDALKVDKSFIHDITANAGSAAIVEAVIKLPRPITYRSSLKGSRAERTCNS
ncbi:MAG TPA: EAL domain-containing protein [Gammaproteobacteria bacterium]|nr:EAL domain-containing protein [Gammaproteobacteria bacterium]